ncbi:hypothetical protein PENSPDRAFT_746704 [Peniophora sp. CONT]|nr:hypothetical protein PENSPDRAFT_746704 [Peniophora sp. CONT]
MPFARAIHSMRSKTCEPGCPSHDRPLKYLSPPLTRQPVRKSLHNNNHTPEHSPASSKIYPPQSYIAISTQAVYSGQTPMLARIALADYWGTILLDTFVQPTQHVTHYGTLAHQYHQQLHAAPTLDVVRHQVMGHIHPTQNQNKILVGYAIWTSLAVLNISHPTISTRDCAVFEPFLHHLRTTQMPPLPILTNRFLGRNIGIIEPEHPVESARAALDLFRSNEQRWEGLIDQGRWPSSLPPQAYAIYFT